jgi:septum formation protein
MSQIPIILASASPARLELLNRIKIFPDQIIPADIDESEHKGELPIKLGARLAFEKAMVIANKVPEAIIIAADTLSVAGRKILPKALNEHDIKYCLEQLSGRRHRVYTGVCIVKKTTDQMIVRQRLVQSIVKLKRLTPKEIEFYCNLDEGLNKAGGYTISGFAECFISYISGSYSNVKGLPLFETVNMLNSLGIYPKAV